MTDIAILDTGCANLQSIKIAIERLNYHPIITSENKILMKSKKIFFPGVGTASAVMRKLSENNILDFFRSCTQPVLGICLGMQLLCQFSEECNGVKTIGVIDSAASLLKTDNLPLPHIGWNRIVFDTYHPLFVNIENNTRFYFVHSYAIPINQFTLSVTQYGSSFFSSAIQKDNFFGVQFHPEKSGNAGSQLLQNFLEI
ncbi:MAG: imidazole glycerol phosphate synthase subunit HisH [Buchnera aphidicola (Pentalonia nigronervosa)]|jgi:glutamine amidotransferase|uniref:Imidazole glycerol phosphate synthase subunit HisH n=1 Tax=Buchnera aphidicola (Pentalonia nigronervosa) TaxID=1309793 RepID=A0A7H1AZD9_9GAMM|nr:MAG: imidazole glycerol phosphate synthase subunit HisH [Buchnera aphidicola (Pentalonia nigronervosa)]